MHIPPCLVHLQLHQGSAINCPACVITTGRESAGSVIVFHPLQPPPPQSVLQTKMCENRCPNILFIQVWQQGVQDNVKGSRLFIRTSPPSQHPKTHSNPDRTSPPPHPPTVWPKPQAIHFFFFVYFSFFSTMQSWKHFALLFLCVNMWMMICYKNVKYVKDHSLFWKNLHLSFWR